MEYGDDGFNFAWALFALIFMVVVGGLAGYLFDGTTKTALILAGCGALVWLIAVMLNAWAGS